jgi:uncharacterized protein YndB with AHSA1/START domain
VSAEAKPHGQSDGERELVLTLTLDAPRAAVWRCWTEPDLLKQWFCPKPWTVAEAEIDVRPGGICRVVMRSPEGQDMDNPGVYLEVVPNEKLVFTDAYTPDWQPSDKPFMTAIVTFADADGGRTRYTARARHWSAADKDAHETMGFHDGWTQCARQLEALAKSL